MSRDAPKVTRKKDATCDCVVPDFIGYIGEPEHWRCLRCGRHPPTDARIHVVLLNREVGQWGSL